MNNFQKQRAEEEELEEDARYQLANVYDVWIATRSKLRGYSTVVFDRLQRVLVFPEEVSEEGEEEEGEGRRRRRREERERKRGDTIGGFRAREWPVRWKSDSGGRIRGATIYGGESLSTSRDRDCKSGNQGVSWTRRENATEFYSRSSDDIDRVVSRSEEVEENGSTVGKA